MRQRNKSYSGKSVNKSPKSKKLSNKNLNDSSNDILYLKDEPILDKDSSFLIEESTTEIPKPEDLVNKSIKTEDETSEKNEVKGARKLTIFLEFGSLNLEVDKSVTDKQMKYIIDQIMGIKVLGDYVEDIEPTTSGSINKNLLKKIKSKSFIDRQHKNLDSPNADLVNFIVSAEMEESVEDVTDVKPLSEISRKLSSKNNSINETDESKMKESQLSNLSSKKSLIDSKNASSKSTLLNERSLTSKSSITLDSNKKSLNQILVNDMMKSKSSMTLDTIKTNNEKVINDLVEARIFTENGTKLFSKYNESLPEKENRVECSISNHLLNNLISKANLNDDVNSNVSVTVNGAEKLKEILSDGRSDRSLNQELLNDLLTEGIEVEKETDPCEELMKMFLPLLDNKGKIEKIGSLYLIDATESGDHLKIIRNDVLLQEQEYIVDMEKLITNFIEAGEEFVEDLENDLVEEDEFNLIEKDKEFSEKKRTEEKTTISSMAKSIGNLVSDAAKSLVSFSFKSIDQNNEDNKIEVPSNELNNDGILNNDDFDEVNKVIKNVAKEVASELENEQNKSIKNESTKDSTKSTKDSTKSIKSTKNESTKDSTKSESFEDNSKSNDSSSTDSTKSSSSITSKNTKSSSTDTNKSVNKTSSSNSITNQSSKSKSIKEESNKEKSFKENDNKSEKNLSLIYKKSKNGVLFISIPAVHVMVKKFNEQINKNQRFSDKDPIKINKRDFKFEELIDKFDQKEN